MISLCAFWCSFNRYKIRTVTRSLGTRMLRSNHETKITKLVQKLSRKFTVRPKGGRSHHRRPLNTPPAHRQCAVRYQNPIPGTFCTKTGVGRSRNRYRFSAPISDILYVCCWHEEINYCSFQDRLQIIYVAWRIWYAYARLDHERRLSVRPSVRPSVPRWYWVKTHNRRVIRFHLRVAQGLDVFLMSNFDTLYIAGEVPSGRFKGN